MTFLLAFAIIRNITKKKKKKEEKQITIIMTETEPPPLPHDVMFDKIMESVGDDDIFQKKFNYIFNMGLVFFASMVYVNIILALNVPDHWCHVPGREFTNMTLDEWRNFTLPM